MHHEAGLDAPKREVTVKVIGGCGSVDRAAGVKEEVHETGPCPDEKCSERRDEHRAASGEGLVVILRVGSERPSRRPDHQPDERRHQSPTAETVRQFLEHGGRDCRYPKRRDYRFLYR